MSAKISVIIVAYNSNEVLMPCLASLERYNPLGEAMEVIVVDNNPTVGLEELIAAKKWNFSVVYKANPTNDGFGGGNNRGVDLATAPVLFFLNPDTILVEDVITPTLKKIEENPDEVVGYSLIDVNGGPNNSFSYLPEYLFFFPLFHFLERLSPLWFVNRVGMLNRIAWPWGAAFSLRKDRFVKAGLFDENIFLCNEEPDLMQRLPHRHLTMLKEHIIHLEGHGREVPVARYLAYLKSLNYYLMKHQIWGQKCFWTFFALKLKIKKALRGGEKDNFDLAYDVFLKEN